MACTIIHPNHLRMTMNIRLERPRFKKIFCKDSLIHLAFGPGPIHKGSNTNDVTGKNNKNDEEGKKQQRGATKIVKINPLNCVTI